MRGRTLRDVTKGSHMNTTAKQQASYVQWQNITEKLEHTLTLMTENHVRERSLEDLSFVSYFLFLDLSLNDL